MPDLLDSRKSRSINRLLANHVSSSAHRSGSASRKNCWSGGKTFLGRAVVLFGLALSAGASVEAGGHDRVNGIEAHRTLPESTHLQAVVDQLRSRLDIAAEVTVTIVEQDARLVSVRRDSSRGGRFLLSVQRDFLAGMGAAQVEAALAHELGHVWIYTHHPYLQTEELANRVAMRAVSREQLVEVYRGVWGAGAVHGDLAAFLGIEERAASPTHR